ncbi:E3 ubiquitin-protein ligase TRAIP-like [Lucilia sericata]|uniref:E3 ubiquitin-protein ligase TRAIP-like n=1 Tax=Lucilia sericata TaxID=13632 RepID=UPI0018A814BE|nr:E3 ubiquitin-protein ligase TRAIP-like [Lucilia sericata]
MPILDIVCPICTDVFKNSDDVYSTSCGHIFHLSCMEEWKRRESSCPQCRHNNPTTHKLFLSFDNSDENSNTLKELELKLKSSNEYNAKLLDQMNETEFNFMHIQEQFTAIEDENRKLKEEIRQLGDIKENFLRLQGQYTKSLEFVKELQRQIQHLLIANEAKSEELKLKCLENETIKASLETAQHVIADDFQIDKIQILERKLKHLTVKLEKEITTSTQLSIDKVKLQSYIENLTSAENTKHYVPQQTNKRANFVVNNDKNDDKINQVKTGLSPPTIVADNNSDANSVLVKGFTELQIKAIPKINIINLGRHMKLKISEKDIVKVCTKENKYNERHNLKSGKVNLIVEFRSSELKVEFLKNKDKLKQYSILKDIEIIDYVSDEIFNLYQYAKILKSHGYDAIYWRNNSVYVKKTRSNLSEPILIKSKNHVDTLKEQI